MLWNQSAIDFDPAKILKTKRLDPKIQAAFSGCLFEGRANFNGSKFGDILIFSAVEALSLPSTRFNGDVDLVATSINDDLDLDNASCAGDFYLTRASIGGSLRCSEVTFAGKCDFRRTHILGKLVCDRTTFGGLASFARISVQGVAQFHGAVFKQEVRFLSAKFASSLFFRVNPSFPEAITIFEGPLKFAGMEVTGQFELTDSSSLGEAENSFNRIRVHGNLLLHGTTFHSAVSFDQAHLGGTLECRGTHFGSDLSMQYAGIRGTVAISRRDDLDAVFSGTVDFSFSDFASGLSLSEAHFDHGFMFAGCKVSGVFELTSSRFTGDETITFRGSSFKQGLLLSGSKFTGLVDLQDIQISGTAQFDESVFESMVDFSGARITPVARFNSSSSSQPTTFKASAVFQHTEFESDVHFDNTIFGAHVSFRDCAFHAAYFSSNGKVGDVQQFASSIDLVGCEYDRLQADWRSLLIQPDGSSRLNPIDRQPYVRLEKSLREAGDDHSADALYVLRRRVEQREKWRGGRRFSWFLDWAYGVTVCYGTQPSRLVVTAVALVIFGALVLSRQGAVCLSGPPQPCSDLKITFREATALSFRYLMPFEVPLGAKYVASPDRLPRKFHFRSWSFNFPFSSALYATLFLRIAGWIIVPVTVAGFTGVLRRVSK